MTYSQKLLDERWQRLRLKVFEKDNWECQSPCCYNPPNLVLHVHYRGRYQMSPEPWDCPIADFTTYCEGCLERQDLKRGMKRLLVEGEFYGWSELRNVLWWQPSGYLTAGPEWSVLSGCFDPDEHPDAPDIILPGDHASSVKLAMDFKRQKGFIPIFVKAMDFGWEYCGKFRVETFTQNKAELAIHAARAVKRKEPISMVMFLEKELNR